MTTKDLQNLPPTVTVEHAAKLLGVGRGSAYEAARCGELPTLRIGRRLVVPTLALLALLGAGPAPLVEAAEAPDEQIT